MSATLITGVGSILVFMVIAAVKQGKSIFG